MCTHIVRDKLRPIWQEFIEEQLQGVQKLREKIYTNNRAVDLVETHRERERELWDLISIFKTILNLNFYNLYV